MISKLTPTLIEIKDKYDFYLKYIIQNFKITRISIWFTSNYKIEILLKHFLYEYKGIIGFF